jgi:hypothetical protein
VRVRVPPPTDDEAGEDGSPFFFCCVFPSGKSEKFLHGRPVSIYFVYVFTYLSAIRCDIWNIFGKYLGFAYLSTHGDRPRAAIL